MDMALEYAMNGFGHTFPNPAVGCVLVRDDTNEVVGRGFHPRAGFPHAEVFALLEAAGLVPNGIDAAQSIVQLHEDSKKKKMRKKKEEEEEEENTNPTVSATAEGVQELNERYKASPEDLVSGIFEDFPVTAYVTLEPCSHYGKTPPCARSLALAKVNRVVVGLRDPNPRVDGGGVRYLEEHGVDVTVLPETSSKGKGDNDSNPCESLVQNFLKRITPPPPPAEEDAPALAETGLTGHQRSVLRSMAGRQKKDGTLPQLSWTAGSVTVPPPTFLERLDGLLWQHELVLVRLNRAVQRKKEAKALGQQLCDELQAHLAQVVGHTALLYRPARPPQINLAKPEEQEQ